MKVMEQARKYEEPLKSLTPNRKLSLWATSSETVFGMEGLEWGGLELFSGN